MLNKAARLIIIVIIISVAGMLVLARAGEIHLASEIPGIPGLEIGVFRGEKDFSLIKHTPYFKLAYNSEFKKNNLLTGFNIGLSNAWLNLGQEELKPLSVFSQKFKYGQQLSVRNKLFIALGLTQNILGSTYWRDHQAVIANLEINPGAAITYKFNPKCKLQMGIGMQNTLASDNVQNINLKQFKLYNLSNYLWIKFLAGQDFNCELNYIKKKELDLYSIIAEKAINQSLKFYLGREKQVSNSMLFPLKDNFKIGTALNLKSAIKMALEVNYSKLNFIKQEKASEGIEVEVKVTLPLLIKHNTQITYRSYHGQTFNYFDNHTQDYYAYKKEIDFINFYRKITEKISQQSYIEFQKFLQQEVTSEQEIVYLAGVLGQILGKFNYQMESSSFYTNSLENIATNEQIYTAMQFSLASRDNNPITSCRGIHRFISEMVSHHDVEGYTASVIKKTGVSHVVSFVVTPKQIYIVDFSGIIPTHTRELKKALQFYQNVNGYPLLLHYLWDKEGRLCDLPHTPDTRLLQEVLTVQKGVSGSQDLKKLFYDLLE